MIVQSEHLTLAERVTRLEEANRFTRTDIGEIKSDVKSILETLAQMSGGKKAMLGLFAVLGGVVTVITGLFSGKLHWG